MALRNIKIHGIELIAGTEIKNLTIETISGDATSNLIPGRLYFDKSNNLLKYVDKDGNIKVAASVEYVDTQIANEAAQRQAADQNLQNQIDTNRADIDDLLAHAIRNDVTSTQEVQGDFRIKGNLFVDGTHTIVNSEVLHVSDNIITLNSDVTSGAPTEDAGISVLRGDEGELVFLKWNETDDQVEVIAGFDPSTGEVIYSRVATEKDIQTINDTIANLDTRVTTLENDVNTIKNSINSVYTFEASTAQTSYTLNHNLNNPFVEVQVWVKDANSGNFVNDIVPITIVDDNTVQIDLAEPAIIRAIVRAVVTV